MNYIIMDLEWNNAYAKSDHKFINEIIEVGAVKLDERLNTLSTFSELIKPVVAKKLRGRIKDLTHITNEDVSTGRSFSEVMHDFSKWCEGDCVIMTWGDTDIRTLLSNYIKFLGQSTIDFIEKYVDLQKYVQQFINMENIQQAGLSYAAGCLEIDPDSFPHHRALDDSILSAECFKKTFDIECFQKFVKICNDDFYARLNFHPYIIKDKNDPLINQSVFNCFCDLCGGEMETVKNWKFANQSFRGVFHCAGCDRQLKATLRIKKFYDHLDIRRNYTEIIHTKNDGE